MAGPCRPYVGADTTRAASAVTPGGAEAPGGEFTTWKFRTKGEARRTIDFIFYGPAALAPGNERTARSVTG